MRILITIALVIIILLLPFFAMLALSKPIFEIEFERADIKDFSKEEYLTITREVLRYVLSFSSDSFIASAFIFSKDEILHLKDVRLILLFALCLLITSVFFVILLRSRVSANSLSTAGKVSLAFLLLLLLSVLSDFDTSFVLFHRILFRNDLWMLPAESALIKLFPESFFFDLAVLWFATSAVISIGFIVSVKSHLKRVIKA